MTQFDAHADDYHAAVERGIAFAGVEHKVFLLAKVQVLLAEAAKLGRPTELAMLDVGCGVGAFARLLVDEVRELHGVDVSAESVARAASEVPRGEFTSYDGSRLPYQDGHVDVSFAVCVFHHVDKPDRAALVAEMQRVTRPGGLVMLFEHNPFNPLTRLVVSRVPFDEGVDLLPAGESRQLLHGAGLTDVKSRFILFAPSAAKGVIAAERALGWLPLGAQYVAVGSVPSQ
jgi:SAM-dependent methyltransferase